MGTDARSGQLLRQTAKRQTVKWLFTALREFCTLIYVPQNTLMQKLTVLSVHYNDKAVIHKTQLFIQTKDIAKKLNIPVATRNLPRKNLIYVCKGEPRA